MYEQYYNPFSQNLAIIKDYFKRTPVLVLAILEFISGIMMIPIALLTASFTNTLMQQVLPLMLKNASEDMDMSQFMQVYGSASSASVISSLLSVIPSVIATVLVAVAFLLIYLKSRNEDPNVSPMPGFTILYVLSVISLVIVSIAAGLMVLVLIIAIVGAGISASNTTDQSAAYMLGFAIGYAVTICLFVFYALFCVITTVRFYGNIRRSMTSVELSRKGALPFGVINVISSIGGVFSVLLMIFLAIFSGAMMPQLLAQTGVPISMNGLLPIILCSLFSTVISLLISIFMAKLALGYKKHIDSYMTGYAPAYAAEQPAMAPPVAPVDYAAPAEPVTYAYPVEQPRQPAPAQEPGYAAPAADPYACPACGAPIDPDNAFCSNCGNKLR